MSEVLSKKERDAMVEVAKHPLMVMEKNYTREFALGLRTSEIVLRYEATVARLEAEKKALIADRIRKVWPGGPHDPPQWLVVPDGPGGDWTSYHATPDEALSAYLAEAQS